MQTETLKDKKLAENSSIPEWVVTLMRAYKEYINTLGAEDAE